MERDLKILPKSRGYQDRCRERFSQGSMEIINSRTKKCRERFSQGGMETSNNKTTNRREEKNEMKG